MEPGAGSWRDDGGTHGRTVEAIEQPIAAPASSPCGKLDRWCLAHDSSSPAGLLPCPFSPGPRTWGTERAGTPFQRTGCARPGHLPCLVRAIVHACPVFVRADARARGPAEHAARAPASTVSSNQSRRISPYFELSRESVST